MRVLHVVAGFLLSNLQVFGAASTADHLCMTEQHAHQVATNWQYLNSAFTDYLADESLVTNFTTWAESRVTIVNTLTPDIQLVSRGKFMHRSRGADNDYTAVFGSLFLEL